MRNNNKDDLNIKTISFIAFLIVAFIPAIDIALGILTNKPIVVELKDILMLICEYFIAIPVTAFLFIVNDKVRSEKKFKFSYALFLTLVFTVYAGVKLYINGVESPRYFIEMIIISIMIFNVINLNLKELCEKSKNSNN